MIVNEFCTMTCGSCSFNDGLCYASMPPKFKCTFDNEFYDGNHICHLELAPVVHAKWLEGYGLIDCVDGDPDESYMVPTWICSNCKSEEEHMTDYCPNCGAEMSLED